MGLSASQARLLTLTARMSDLELQGQQISNSKIRLAVQSENIAKDYANALNRQKLTVLSGYNGSTPNYADLTYNLLTGVNSPLVAQYGLTDNNNRLLVTQDIANKFKTSTSLDDFLTKCGAEYTTTLTTTTMSPGVTQAEYDAAQNKVNSAKSDLDAKTKATQDAFGVLNAITTARGDLDAFAAKYDIKGYKGAGVWQYTDNITQTAVDNSKTLTCYSDSAVFNYLNQLGSNSAAVSDSKFNNSGGGLDSSFSYSLGQFTYLNLNGENVNTAKTTFNSLAGDVSSDLTKALGSLTGLASDKLSAALTSALGQTESHFGGYFLSKVDNRSGARNQVAGQNGIATGKEDDTYSIDVKQLVSTMLTYFDQYCAQNYGGTASGNVGATSTTRGATGGTGNINGHPSNTTSDPVSYNYMDNPDKIVFQNMNGESRDAIIAKYNDLLTKYNTAMALPGAENAQCNYDKALAAQNAAQKVYDDALAALNGMTVSTAIITTTPRTVKTADADYYTNLYNKMQGGYFTEEDENSTLNNSSWLQYQIMNGNLTLNKVVDSKWQSVSWRSDSSIVQETDDSYTAKAEAEYTAENAEIQVKDKQFDLELKNIDTEHEAIQTEIDSVKKVIDKNIERSFKTFDA